MNTISNKEAALLGLISEKPKHAYEIETDVKEREMRYWTEISMSSIYKLLKKLEETKFLKSEIRLSKNNVVQKVYSITDRGKEAFKDKLQELISAWRPTIYPIDIGLANLNLLSKKEATKQLTKYLESLDKMIKCYGELEKFLVDGKCHLGNIQLATRRIILLKAERKWVSDFITKFQEVKNGKGNAA